MRVLTSLTYYTPHISGLTLYARIVHEGLAARGHSVTVMTSRYDRELPRDEHTNGTHVVRNRVWMRLNKGVLMPGYFWRTCRELHKSDVLYLHLPQIEASFVAVYARFVARKPIVTTYHCDLELPPGPAKVLFTPFIKLSHLITVLLSSQVVVLSEDYARGSRFLSRFMNRIVQCYPPCPTPEPDANDPLPAEATGGSPVIGFVGRFAEEKGIEYILRAAPAVLEKHPNAVFAFVGEREKTFGEKVFDRLKPQIDALGDRVRLLGLISAGHLADFYRRCDVLLLPSINSTEAFGLVQIEAMLSGTPVIASEIPGVREPVRVTGMGKLVPPRDADALSAAILDVLGSKETYCRVPADLERIFGLNQAVDFYESLFGRLATAPVARSEQDTVAPGGLH